MDHTPLACARLLPASVGCAFAGLWTLGAELRVLESCYRRIWCAPVLGRPGRAYHAVPSRWKLYRKIEAPRDFAGPHRPSSPLRRWCPRQDSDLIAGGEERQAPTLSTQLIPTAEQLHAARLTRWHQAATTHETPGTEETEAETVPSAADRVLTQQALREFIQHAGLVLFAPRAQLTSPAPTVAEAVLGRTDAAPSLADTAEARTLVARLIEDGSAVALNLLGAPNTTADNPDFLCSAAVFPYVFTLRGDKLWKQPPSNAGAAKVSPLAINTYVLLAEGGPRTAADLVNDLGKGLTEAAVLRALGELWQHLRVLPVSQADGSPALWETATTRLTKQIKAGANAGQPSALSALASLYLRQALLATEDEIETFLSPLASRSRVRGVLHDLLAAQQLDSVVIEGRQQLYVAGEMPDFGTGVAATAATDVLAEAAPVEMAEDGSRIRSFTPRKVGTGYIGRAKPFVAAGGRPERERRPFSGAGGRAPGKGASKSGYAGKSASRSSERPDRTAGRERPSFARPWEEERVERSRRAPADAGTGAAAGRREFAAGAGGGTRERSEPRPAARGSRPGFADRARGGERPAYSRRPEQGTRPAFSRNSGPPRAGRATDRAATPRPGQAEAEREFRSSPRAGGPSGETRPQRPWSSTRGTGADRDRTRPTRPAGSSGADRRDAGTAKPYPRRSNFTGNGAERPAFRRFDAPRPEAKRSADPRSNGERPARPPFAGAGGRTNRTQADGGRRSGTASGADRPRTREGRPERAGGAGTFARPKAGAWRGAPGGGEGRTPGAKRASGGFKRGSTSTSAGSGPFEKFKGGNKPWGKRPPARKSKPDEGES